MEADGCRMGRYRVGGEGDGVCVVGDGSNGEAKRFGKVGVVPVLGPVLVAMVRVRVRAIALGLDREPIVRRRVAVRMCAGRIGGCTCRVRSDGVPI